LTDFGWVATASFAGKLSCLTFIQALQELEEQARVSSPIERRLRTSAQVAVNVFGRNKSRPKAAR
jgi:hypothetical protein